MIKIALTLYIAHTIITAYDYRNSSPVSLFPYNVAAIDYALPDSLSNPAYIPLIKYPYINFSGSKPYSLEGILSTNLKCGYSFKNIGFQAAWNRFGIDQYREDIVEANTGYMVLKYLSLGLGINYYKININTNELSFSSGLIDGKASILIIPFEWIHISSQFDNLGSFLYKKRSKLLFPEWSTGLSIKPIKGLSIAWNINRTAYGYINSFSISAHLLQSFSLKGGYARETSSYSAAISFAYKYISASYGIKSHPHLGITHLIGVTLSTEELKFENLEYHNIFNKENHPVPVKKININTCTIDELKGIPVLKEIFAERIMKYRKMIGPISKKSLVQIGMESKEVDKLLDYIYGLDHSADKDEVHSIKNNKAYQGQLKKNIFQKLIQVGLTAATAYELSEIAITGNREKVISKINSLSGFDNDKMKEIKRICLE